MAKYRKKPVVIDAIQVDDTNLDTLVEWVQQHNHESNYSQGSIYIRTLEGTMRADKDDWIIKGVKGEFYPCKPDVFAATYEPVEVEP